MNPMKLVQARSALAQFEKRHPRVRGFLESVSKDALREGTIVEVSVTTPEGRNYITNIKVTQEDIDLYKEVRGMNRSGRNKKEGSRWE